MSKNVDIYLLTVYCILYILIIVKGQTNRNIRTQSWESKVKILGENNFAKIVRLQDKILQLFCFYFELFIADKRKVKKYDISQ